MNTATATAVNWTEQGLVPESVIRHGIRRLLRRRLTDINADDCELAAATLSGFVEMMRLSEIAPVPHLANEQHYEVPAEFFAEVLGDHAKYSCCYWADGDETLTEAEEAALRITCSRARIGDGMSVLDLGCGWGSVTLWIAEHYPSCRITAVSNSRAQHDFIVAAAKSRGLDNVSVIVCDMNDFEISEKFDRVVSVEMFEHMRNYDVLYRKISRWLKPNGLFFMHIFCHRSTPYEFLDNGPGDWMSRHFFSGGIMPSDDLPLHFQQDLNIVDRWRWSGTHYAKTANAWLAQMDERKTAVMKIITDTYGEPSAQTWWMRWRIFFMACAELFEYANGQEWYVGHYLFKPAHRSTRK